MNLAKGLLVQATEEATVRTFMIIGSTLLLASTAFAQVRVEVVAPPPPRVQVVAPPPPRVYAPPPPSVTVEAPSIRFEAAPPLVEVEPGVQVVEDNDEEIYFVGGYYWHPVNGVWYRTRSYRGGWVAAPRGAVPARIVHIPPGQYRHYRREARMERHEEHRMEKDERRMEKDQRRMEKDERKAEKHHGH
jgi:hypothetical protein